MASSMRFFIGEIDFHFVAGHGEARSIIWEWNAKAKSKIFSHSSQPR